MTAEEALEESIAHWEENLERATNGMLVGEHIFSDDCPLCDMFLFSGPQVCVGCPVKQASGESNCRNTPWNAVLIAVDARASTAAITAAVQMELNFLKSLREGKAPESEQDQ